MGSRFSPGCNCCDDDGDVEVPCFGRPLPASLDITLSGPPETSPGLVHTGAGSMASIDPADFHYGDKPSSLPAYSGDIWFWSGVAAVTGTTVSLWSPSNTTACDPIPGFMWFGVWFGCSEGNFRIEVCFAVTRLLGSCRYGGTTYVPRSRQATGFNCNLNPDPLDICRLVATYSLAASADTPKLVRTYAAGPTQPGGFQLPAITIEEP